MSPIQEKFEQVRAELEALGGEVSVCAQFRTAVLRYNGVVNEFQAEQDRVLMAVTIPPSPTKLGVHETCTFSLDGQSADDRFYDLLTTFGEYGVKALRIAQQAAA